MVAKTLFIEGTTDDTNGDLRKGFNKLLAQKLAGNMPRIKMGNGITTTIDTFKNNKLSKYSVLLIDLDAFKIEKSQKLSDYNLTSLQNETFFMIQEMEAWFLSQSEILDAFYEENISSKISKANHENIPHPAEVLMTLTRGNKKGIYHKVKHGVKLLELLNADRLEESSTEFAALIKRLQAI